jgi:sodium/potassium/calcium exchanger 6
MHYLGKYYCTKPILRPVAFVGLLIWLIFLFSTLGISASDFFTPNLATLAQLLGLDENVAGVTFLAFGNGSPDVFSTFSAMRANSGSLAIGELLGAASFIVSCVVGSMCIIKPFKVHRKPFLRDVGFFTVAVSLLLAILWDGRLFSWEAGILVALYVVYVMVVIVGTWWDRRQEKMRRVEAMIRAEYDEDEETHHPIFHDEQPYRDERKFCLVVIHYIF